MPSPPGDWGEGMKDNWLTALLAALLAAALAYLRELLIPVLLLFAAMLTDYVTGMIRAWYTRTLCSRVGLRGIVRKLTCLFAVAVGVVVDWVLQAAWAKTGLGLEKSYFVGLTVTVWLILNECISVLENLADMGTPVPRFLRKLTERLRRSSGQDEA